MKSFLSKLFLALGNWLSNKPKQDDRYEVYRPDEVLIYSYWNGERTVKADPLVLYKKMLNIKPELVADLKVAGSIHSDAMKFHNQALDKMYKMFEANRFDGEKGLTEIGVQELFDHFIVYTERVKKNGSLPSTSQTATSPSTPSPTTRAENPTTPSTSDSGSTETEPKTVAPTPCAPPSESPSDSQPLETTTGRT